MAFYGLSVILQAATLPHGLNKQWKNFLRFLFLALFQGEDTEVVAPLNGGSKRKMERTDINSLASDLPSPHGGFS